MAYVKSTKKARLGSRSRSRVTRETWYYPSPTGRIFRPEGGPRTQMLFTTALPTRRAKTLAQLDFADIERRVLAHCGQEMLLHKGTKANAVSPRELWDLDQLDYFDNEDLWGKS